MTDFEIALRQGLNGAYPLNKRVQLTSAHLNTAYDYILGVLHRQYPRASLNMTTEVPASGKKALIYAADELPGDEGEQAVVKVRGIYVGANWTPVRVQSAPLMGGAS